MALNRNNLLALLKGVIVVGGLIILTAFLPLVSADRAWIVGFLIVCAVIAGLMDVQLSQGGSVSVDSAVVLASIILVPLPETLLIIVSGTIIAAFIKGSWRARGGIGFLVTSKAIGATAAWAVYYLAWGQAGRVDPIGGLPALIMLCVVYFVFEIVQEELGKRKMQMPSSKALIASVKFLFPLYLTFSSLAVLLALLYDTMGLWSALFFFAPLWITRHAFKRYMDIRRAYRNTIKALANTIEAQGSKRRGHAERVADIATGIAKELGLHGRNLELVSYGALLHDIGMIGTEDDINAEQLDHAEVGAEIIEQVESIKDAADMVRLHHAPFEGDGIPLGGRIISVASRFDELTNDISLAERLDDRTAFAKIKRDQGLAYDPKVVRALAGILRKRGVEGI